MPTGRRHYRVTSGDALAAHDAALETGGWAGSSKWDDLLSALGRPYHGYHRHIWSKAAALLEGVATSHGFNDGNKRTAVILTMLLIERSGYRFQPLPGEDADPLLADFTEAVVKRQIPRDEIAPWFKARIVKA